MKNRNALIGHTGFVGSNLLNLKKNLFKFNSKNIYKIENQKFNVVICAATSSKIWLAKKNPKLDKQKISFLIKYLKTVKAKKFVLISTCEVYGKSNSTFETSKIHLKKNMHYGINRHYLENFVQKNFGKSYIIRLPIVYGKNFSKNCIYDLIYKNNVDKLNGKDLVQIYNVTNLKKHINYVLKQNIFKLNISSEPIKLSGLAKEYFNIDLNERRPFRKMNMKSIYGNKKGYFMSRKNCLQDLKKFLKKTKNEILHF